MPNASQPALGTDYDLLDRQVCALLESESDFIANAANFAAFVYHELVDVNWAGFYFPAERGLVLGPFGGQPACTRLPAGRGVCGAAFASGKALLVDDVTRFRDHIACDSRSRSEIVVPLIHETRIAGVFDVDSPLHARFAASDRDGLERLVRRFVTLTAIPSHYWSDVASAAGADADT